MDTGGSQFAAYYLQPWKDPTSLEEIRNAYSRVGYRAIERIDAELTRLGARTERFLREEIPVADANLLKDLEQVSKYLIVKASLFLWEGEANKAYEVLEKARKLVTSSDELSARWLYTIIYFQGVVGLRRGENENCIECRGESSCIFPLSPSAMHTNPAGSSQAISHFTEYLEEFPEDEGVRWLLNLAYMTLGQHPTQVPQPYLMTFERFGSEFDIGRFRDIGHLVGVNRFNMAGGAIMDDFDNDGLLDIVVSTCSTSEGLAFYRNEGDGFHDCTERAGVGKQYGGFNIVQADYDNDGFLDIFVSRGGWWRYPMRPTLLRNNGDGTFTDVTRQAGLMEPANSLSAAWADYDNDGFLDLFVCCDFGPNRLYRNNGDGTFAEVAELAGVQGVQKNCKGANWIDFDNDGYPDLFVTFFESTPQLFHNNRDGTFLEVTGPMGIRGPNMGFACWAFDFDNDGWLDILATSYDRRPSDLVRDMRGEPVSKDREVTRLYRNLGGKKFQDVSKETGIGRVFATMGSNFADFDNDGFLDIYLGTGDPNLETLVPNRMFKNMGGRRFADITATSGTGHLQKGHGVSCGDWDRDGNIDLFVETGGASPGDRYHNVLFQNPGQGNHWLTVKLIGKKTNRAALGARIKVITAGKNPMTVHRHVTSGSSWGANPLQQTMGLAKAAAVASLEIHWPTSGTTQVFHNLAANQAIEVTEFAAAYRKLNWTRLPAPGARWQH